ncbi:unnamed protein product [Trifolium pratense]|uniref:Uncharacterized protein n=1 Tax=Trifolium pratense TaxID=57577 RepID=A0ACB0KFE3_TRIPR|nr:unnamed protein product [Trifolium pratense]
MSSSSHSYSYYFDMVVEREVNSALPERPTVTAPDHDTDDRLKKDTNSGNSQPHPRSAIVGVIDVNEVALPFLSEHERRRSMKLSAIVSEMFEGIEEELMNRPNNGAIYDEILTFWTTVKERLKFLSKNHGELSIDEAIEIYDASVLSNHLKKHEHEIELAGKIAHSGVLLILQGQRLEKEGHKELALSKSELKKAYV